MTATSVLSLSSLAFLHTLSSTSLQHRSSETQKVTPLVPPRSHLSSPAPDMTAAMTLCWAESLEHAIINQPPLC